MFKSMIVRCKYNQISQVPDKDVQERLRESIHLEGVIEPLEVGKEYIVQAIIRWEDGGIRIYLDVDDGPHPYPVDLFDFVSEEIPVSWEIFPTEAKYENNNWVRITFPEWASDDVFFEKLIDGDAEALAIYKNNKIN